MDTNQPDSTYCQLLTGRKLRHTVSLQLKLYGKCVSSMFKNKSSKLGCPCVRKRFDSKDWVTENRMKAV